MKHRLHIHIEQSAITQLHEISRATGRSTAHWIRQAVDDLVAKMGKLGVVDSSAPLRSQRREPWEREIREELLARKELEEKLGPRDKAKGETSGEKLVREESDDEVLPGFV